MGLINGKSGQSPTKGYTATEIVEGKYVFMKLTY
jgi:hypothetical protein